jgi:hypothetical protein
LTATCRSWLAVVGAQGAGSSGGVVAYTNLLGLKNEVSEEREAMAFERITTADMLHRWRLDRDHVHPLAHHELRRLYPITLLGPRLASVGNVELLRAAGARVEHVGTSLLVQTYPEIVSAWSPEYLASTVALRNLAWPISIQNPADVLGLGRKEQFQISRPYHQPSWEPPVETIEKELRRQIQAFNVLVKARPPGPVVAGELRVVGDST